MSNVGDITAWLLRLKDGDPAAAERLWETYYRLLVGLARQRLRNRPCAAADEEDIAISAFNSFCKGVAQGRFPRLDDRDDLWRVLVTLTARKACRLIRDEQRQKRGGGAVRHTSSLTDEDLAAVISTEPTPEFAAQVAEECARLLALLPNPGLRQIAVWKMEGYTTDEIAGRLTCAPRSVERKLHLIREFWVPEATEPG